MRWLLRLVTAAALGVDAYVHADLSGRYDPIKASISQGNLFRIESAVAALLALVVLVVPRREVYAVAFLVAASALGAILLYRYNNVGQLGPLPNMYEPLWFTKKTTTAVAEAVAVVTSVIGVGLTWRLRQRRRQAAVSA